MKTAPIMKCSVSLPNLASGAHKSQLRCVNKPMHVAKGRSPNLAVRATVERNTLSDRGLDTDDLTVFTLDSYVTDADLVQGAEPDSDPFTSASFDDGIMVVDNGKGKSIEIDPLAMVYTKQFPGTKSKAMITDFHKIIRTYPWPFVVDVGECEGLYISTVDNQKILDFGGLYGSLLLRYNHPRMTTPEVAAKLATAATTKLANPDFLSLQCYEYYKLLHRIRPKSFSSEKTQVYVVNSGAEAVENCMKYVLKLQQEKLESLGQVLPRARRFIYFDSGYHGRNVYTLSVTDIAHDPNIDDFNEQVVGNLKVPFPYVDHDAPHEENIARMEHTLAMVEGLIEHYGHEVVGCIIEVLQGAGGNRTALPEFFTRLSLLLEEKKRYIIVDEVQTSGGCLGAVWSVDLLDLPYGPHALASAKKCANGVVYLRQALNDEGILDSTWGGSITDMTKFTEEWKIVEEENLIEAVSSKEKVLVRGLRRLQEKHGNDMVRNVRGIGLYQGFTTDEKSQICEIALQTESLFLLGAGPSTIRFRPPLDVTIEEIELMLSKLDVVLCRVQSFKHGLFQFAE
ncbi:hypothetical protein CYMTET_5719 [Cymbomonas tetramitiformis]|uniref:Uncharacterized protein n=1 Tax=Cymbomonas tetramitiformis TaxID=36881 RepID=A0AAE0LIL1_9CHLO|nr:hypothetical protein CYMTET_5719 [Cymbomonas tetramitiformis]